MYKYQFHIAFNDKANTAGAKAVQDCKSILSELGYRDCSIEDLAYDDAFYRPKLINRLFKFFLHIRPKSLVAIQYPLLSGNAVFKYFIKASRFKNVKFFCVIHDLDDLRYAEKIGRGHDVEALNYYDYVIVHNEAMKNWLQLNRLTSEVVVLNAFDYLSVVDRATPSTLFKPEDSRKIVFAGNLAKSRFVYALDIINKWEFNLYGPNYLPEKASMIKNICWNGSLSPDEVLTNMKGAFGLVWDGEYIDRLDTEYGNYLKYNYPHKLSLYLAAGLPVIAPRQSAISNFIEELGVGILIDDLIELQDVVIDENSYSQMKANAQKVSNDLTAGRYFSSAVGKIEADVLLNVGRLQPVHYTPDIQRQYR